MKWQDEASQEKWDEWMAVAVRRARRLDRATTLGPEDYAASAIEKLLRETSRPPNIEAWLSTTIKNQYIDRFRKIRARGGPDIRELSDFEWEQEMIAHAFGSPSIIILIRESVGEVLDVLNEQEKEILLMKAAGIENHEIAERLGYRSNKIVATRLGQISRKVREKAEEVSQKLL